jgi:hypothetical protein
MPKRSKRPTFKSEGVALLDCTPGNYDGNGDPATIITVISNHTGEVQPLVIDLNDTRKLTVRLLASLNTADDEFAARLLMQMFPHDQSGRFHWPSSEPPE